MLYSVEERESTMNFITKAPVMLRGGDYNPDQWLDRPDILEADNTTSEISRWQLVSKRKAAHLSPVRYLNGYLLTQDVYKRQS